MMPKDEKTAYIRLPDVVYELMKKLENEHKIIGFDYDGSRNFGIVVEDKDEDDA